MEPREDAILRSWERNAAPWTAVIRGEGVDSRVRVTDRAILDAVLAFNPSTVLDVGTGEGWLVREFSRRGIDALGVDAVPSLVEAARDAGGGAFRLMSYQELVDQGLSGRTFDAVVCNFSLIGKDSTEAVVGAAPGLLSNGGKLIVQTLHPIGACGDLPYVDGWRDGSWDGFGDDFVEPAPWFFRTIESWKEMLMRSGLRVERQIDPVDPDTRAPASIIFVCS